MADLASILLPDLDAKMLLISMALCTLLGVYVYFRGVLDKLASIIAAVLGFLLIGYSDMFWFLLLLLFLVICYSVTMWNFKKKAKNGSAQGKKGERGVKNVLANGIIPLSIAILSGPLDQVASGLPGFMFITALSVAAADTFASEIGIMARRPRLITDPRKVVEPGIDGGISLLGNLSALFGSFLIAFFGFHLITVKWLASSSHTLEASWWLVLLIGSIGFIGCQIDSLLGATLQSRGYLSNDSVNLLTILMSAILAIPVYLLIS
jgi:uncharacterized protein (TIGR00297 family)